MEEPLSRRRLLGLSVGLGAAVALTGCGVGAGGPGPIPRRAQCVPRSSLQRHTRLAGLPLVYEVSGRRTAFWFDAGFAARLETWLQSLRAQGMAIRQLWTYGAWTDGRSEGACRSWHHSGRAFDLARLELTDGRFVSCRFDQWQSLPGTAQGRAQRDYWALAASLHREFAYVVTYPYNRDHHNHIHVDNARSGTGRSRFNPRSPTQLQAIQAISTHVWQRPVEPTGGWDSATRRATAAVLADLGQAEDLTAPDGWDRYLAASAARLTD